MTTHSHADAHQFVLDPNIVLPTGLSQIDKESHGDRVFTEHGL